MSEEKLAGGTRPAATQRVFDVAESSVPGRVMTYGVVAVWPAEGRPRQAGGVPARHSATVPRGRDSRVHGALLPERGLEHAGGHV